MKNFWLPSILDDKEKNIIKDILVNKTKVRFQKVHELPFKDLRSLVDKGKKELNNGVVIVYAIKDDKIGLAIGITQELSKKINAVDLVLKLVQKLLVEKVVEVELILLKLEDL